MCRYLFLRGLLGLCVGGAITAGADELLRYHDGARWIEVDLAHNEIAAFAPKEKAAPPEDAVVAVPGAKVLEGSTETLRYLRLPGAKGKTADQRQLFFPLGDN